MRLGEVEWPTLFLVVGCYLVWGAATTWVASWSLFPAILLTSLAVALHSSLTHEIVHGHPFRNETLNAALVFPALILVIPFARFRDTHLAHHMDAVLTDPYDDPETNYLDPEVWSALPGWARAVLSFNNTLLGRLTIGPAVSQIAFMAGDLRLARAGDERVRRGWLWHIPAVALVLAWLVWVAAMPLWAYAVAVYGAISILKIRTFLEHQAHERARGRTVIIEDRGPLAFLFLNNNLHVVHHMHPRVPWYRLRDLYFNNKDRYTRQNGGYLYRSYGEIFRRYLWTAKDPVPHPFWKRR